MVEKLKTAMVIPSYWGRDSSVGWKKGDSVFDHPTPLDKNGTLLRTIESMSKLDESDFELVIIAAATTDEIGSAVQKKVSALVSRAAKKVDMDIRFFGPENLKKIHSHLIARGVGEWGNLLMLNNYPNVRNLCIFLPHVLGSDIAILIDDDEVFEDPSFISKAREFIGREINGERVYGVAGYYLQPEGGCIVKREVEPWMEHWDQLPKMNEAFDKLICRGPRIKKTPLVFGGNMIIHREIFSRVPFDPQVPRGEDIDYLMNARMFGFNFYMDNELSIKHLAPPKTHPLWKRFREDIYRFVYERAKIRGQHTIKGMTRITADDFDPYPGALLKDDLEVKVRGASEIIAMEYAKSGDEKGANESLRNIEIALNDAKPDFNPFDMLIKQQKRWEAMMRYTFQPDVREILSQLF